MASTRRRAMTLGESALTGWRGSVGKAVAKPVARRSGFSEEQVRAVLGFLILGYTLYRIVRPMMRAARTT